MMMSWHQCIKVPLQVCKEHDRTVHATIQNIQTNILVLSLLILDHASPEITEKVRGFIGGRDGRGVREGGRQPAGETDIYLDKSERNRQIDRQEGGMRQVETGGGRRGGKEVETRVS